MYSVYTAATDRAALNRFVIIMRLSQQFSDNNRSWILSFLFHGFFLKEKHIQKIREYFLPTYPCMLINRIMSRPHDHPDYDVSEGHIETGLTTLVTRICSDHNMTGSCRGVPGFVSISDNM